MGTGTYRRPMSSYDLVAIGRAGIDLYSLDLNVPLRDVTKFAKYVGGSAANIVVGAARLGLRTALVTRVSADDLGDFIIAFLEREGVDVRHVVRDPTRKTGIVFAEIFPGRESRFIFYRENAADLYVTRGDVEGAASQARSVVITGTGLSAEPSRSANMYALEVARRRGAIAVLNLDWRPTLWSASKEERVRYYMEAMDMADILIGNEAEYMAATGRDDVDEALRSIPGRDEKVLVVTRGARGSTVYHRGEEVHAPPFKVEMLKSLGAGDGFIAGFMYGVLRGWDYYRAARLGNAVGSIVVTRHSCSDGMPRYEEVMAFIERHGGF